MLRFRSVAVMCALLAAPLFISCRAPSIDCFGFDRHSEIAVHLVEQAQEGSGTYPYPSLASVTFSLPSCNGFDGVAAGETFAFTDVEQHALRAPSQRCALPLGGVEEVAGQSIEPPSREGRDMYSWPSILFMGPGAIAPYSEIAGCTGTWTLSTFPVGIMNAHVSPDGFDYSQIVSAAWSDEWLFDALTPGSEPPVLIIRTFKLNFGTTCPGLPEGVTECEDLFAGYYVRVP